MRDPQLTFTQSYRSVSIVNSFGEKYNITPNVAELNIFEDLFSNTLSGNVIVIDDKAMMDKMRLNGNEKLTIEFYDSKTDYIIDIREFYLYSTTARKRINPTSEGYVLQFCSIENVLNAHTRCYQALQGPNSSSVRGLYAMLDSTKPSAIEETTGVYKFVMPSWTPFEGINWYVGRSISAESGGSYFLFYETLKSFNFKSVESLIGTTPKYTYYYEPAGTAAVVKDASNIREYEIVEIGDSLKGADEQFTTMWTNDIIRKKIVKKDFAVDKNNKGKLNGSLIGVAGKNGFGIDLDDRRERFGSNVIVRNETRNVHTQTSGYYRDSIQPKLSAMRQFSNLKIRFIAFGHRKFNAGDVIDINFLRSEMITVENKNDSEDKLMSGKYLVTAIRYMFKPQDFHIVVEAVKDSRKD